MKLITERFSLNEIFVNDAYFSGIESNENGAAMCIVSSNIKCILYFISFSYCLSPVNSKKYGGCIYFSSIEGEFSINKSCAFHCSSYISNFLHSSLEKVTTNQNTISLISYSCCPSEYLSDNIGTCRLFYGTGNANQVNSSKNFIKKDIDFGIDSCHDTYTNSLILLMFQRVLYIVFGIQSQFHHY